MNHEKHYEELTQYIQLEGVVPFANSMPNNIMFLNKKHQKHLKKNDIDCQSYMNVIYERPQDFKKNTVLTWQLHDDQIPVYCLEEKKLFVKGMWVWAYCVGIIEE